MKKKVNKICIVLCDHESSVAFQVKKREHEEQSKFYDYKVMFILKSATHYGNKNCNF